MRCMPLCILEVVEVVLEVPDVTRCALLCLLEGRRSAGDALRATLLDGGDALCATPFAGGVEGVGGWTCYTCRR